MKPRLILTIGGVLLLLFVLKIYGVITAPDIQCHTSHNSILTPPSNPKTAKDFFELGNYHYDVGNCLEAVVDYTRTIELDPNYPQAYNNRAYTNMRLRNYPDALVDLDKAIELKPDYVEALMNRGDIHNYYFAIDRKAAIADYDRVIAIGAERDRSGSVCGHKAMAQANNIIPLAILKTISHSSCK